MLTDLDAEVIKKYSLPTVEGSNGGCNSVIQFDESGEHTSRVYGSKEIYFWLRE